MGHFPTLDLWRGPFGDSYHKRNRFAVDDVRPVFDKILNGIQIDGVLEVGCGLGHNLMAIPARFRAGIEPNKDARMEANKRYSYDPADPNFHVYDADATNIPFKDGVFDLVLTCGLLIHIPPDDVRKVIEEICRVSSRYVLAIEYAFPVEEAREYRGEKDALWVRPYGKLLEAWGGLKIIGHEENAGDLYPGCEWWLCEKR